MLIELHQLIKVYDTSAGYFTALDGVDLSIEKGEFVSIVGKSGSGKTTLINMVTGIDQPTSGEIYVAGTAVHTLNENQIAKTYQDALYKAGTPVIVFGVKDIQQEFERLKTLGVNFTQEPTKTDWGTQAIFDDTCGNFVQLHQDD